MLFKKILNLTLIRILLFLVTFWFLVLFFQSFFSLELIFYNIDYLSALLLASYLFELFFNITFNSFGLKFDNLVLLNLLYVLLITFTSILIIFSMKLIFVDINSIATPNLPDLMRLIFAQLIVSFVEEIGFRGILLQIIRAKYGVSISMILTSLFFALMHINNPNTTMLSVINIFLAGILFSYMVLKSGSLWPPIIFHFIWNSLSALVISSPVSGFNYYSIVRFEDANDILFIILFGGKFGIEGGLIVTSVLIFSMYFCHKLLILSPYSESMRLKNLYSI